jgi:hypothetical protein
VFTSFKAHVRSWIAGLARPHPAAPAGACGPGALDFYHPVLEPIGNDLNCWRLRHEHDREFAHRIATEISLRLNKLDADLDRVCNYRKG